MQNFLGTALVCKDFVNNYSEHTAKLNDMTRNDFNWDESLWKEDYKLLFENVKSLTKEAVSIFFPDYSLKWELFTDASQVAVGAMLVQYKVVMDKDGEPYDQMQPIGLISKKFSEVATRWSTIEQEGYGVYFGVKSFDYYLKGKEFIIRTDHRNLLWMEMSSINKIVRWRLFLQGFRFKLIHIEGKLNFSADALSRLLFLQDFQQLESKIQYEEGKDEEAEDLVFRCMAIKDFRELIQIKDRISIVKDLTELTKQEMFNTVHGRPDSTEEELNVEQLQPHLGVLKCCNSQFNEQDGIF